MSKKVTSFSHKERVKIDTLTGTAGKQLQPNGYIEIEKLESKVNSHNFFLHSHKHYEIYFLTSGTRQFFYSDSFITISAPTILIMPPNHLHTSEGGAYERYDVDVSPSYLNDLQASILNRMKLHVLKPNAEQARRLVSIVNEMSELNDHSPFLDQTISTLFSYYVYEIGKLDINTANEGPIPESKLNHDGGTLPETLMKIIRYMNDNFPSKITMDELSSRFGMSKGTINYSFNKYLNVTPIDYLINIRLINSTAYLENTSLTISQIADKCGFMSSNHYTLMFKRKNGISPSEYRKKKQS